MTEEIDIIKRTLKQIKRIEIKTKRLIQSHFSGSYRSIFKGQGIDFEEIREYMPGDDVRLIDWNVTAKTKKLYIKNFREYRERVLLIAVDISASLNYGSTTYSKREILTEVSSILAFSAIKNNDKVGLLLFSDKIEQFIPPKKGKKHVLRILRDILFFRAQSEHTSLTNACTAIQRLLKKQSIVFFLSDFIFGTHEEKQQFYKQIGILHHRHELIAIRVSDPMEHTFLDVGWIHMQDSEEKTNILIHSKEINNFLKTHHHSECMQQEKELKKYGIKFLHLHANDDYIATLQQFFVKKQ